MAGFYGYSSMFSYGRSNALSSMYSNLSQYASVRSGAYMKATKAYYAKVAGSDTTSTKSSSKTTSKSDNWLSQSVTSRLQQGSEAINTTRNAASKLMDSAKKLTTTGKDSLFADKEKYDSDAAYKAVAGFISDYNNTVNALKNTSNTSVTSTGSSMMRMSGAMSNSLSQIGITVGKDGKLSVDEETFKNTDMDKVKKVFNGSGSYAGIVSSSASRVVAQAGTQLRAYGSSTYGNTGSYYNNSYNSYSSGWNYNGYF